MHRRELRETWDNARRIAKERGRIEREIGEVDKLLDEADTQHEENTAPLYVRIEAIRQAGPAAERARRDLWDICSYPELKDGLAQVSERFRDLHSQLTDLESRAADTRWLAKGDRQEIGFAADKTQEVELSERAERYAKIAKKLEAEAAALRPEINKLQQEEKRIRDLMLEP